jgi:amidohydrolase
VDNWYGVINGKGGHGAHPEQTVDPFYLLAHVILGLNGIVSRRIHPFEPAVVSIGVVNGGFTENVIPDEVKISGTFRYANPQLHEQLRGEIRRAFEIARALGGEYNLRFEYGGPPMVNDKKVSEVIENVGKELLGAQHVHEMGKTLGAEDFGEFLRLAPGAMFTLGTQKAGHEAYQLHHPRFDLDERALPIGTAMLAETALRFLKSA